MDGPEVSRRPHDMPGVIAAFAFICLGVLLIGQSRAMTPMGSVFPIAISTAMIVFSVVLIIRNVVIGLRRQPAGATVSAPEEVGAEARVPAPAAEPESNVRRLAFLVAMVAWIVLIPVLGFFVTSLLAYFAVMATSLHERIDFREALILGVIGIVVLTGFYLLMAEVLLLPLPRGAFF